MYNASGLFVARTKGAPEDTVRDPLSARASPAASADTPDTQPLASAGPSSASESALFDLRSALCDTYEGDGAYSKERGGMSGRAHFAAPLDTRISPPPVAYILTFLRHCVLRLWFTLAGPLGGKLVLVCAFLTHTPWLCPVAGKLEYELWGASKNRSTRQSYPAPYPEWPFFWVRVFRNLRGEAASSIREPDGRSGSCDLTGEPGIPKNPGRRARGRVRTLFKCN